MKSSVITSFGLSDDYHHYQYCGPAAFFFSRSEPPPITYCKIFFFSLKLYHDPFGSVLSTVRDTTLVMLSFNPDKELPSLDGKVIFVTGGL